MNNARKLGDWMKTNWNGSRKIIRPSSKTRAASASCSAWNWRKKIPAFAASEKPPAIQFVNRLHAAGVLTIPAGTHIIRLLPPLNLKPQEAGEGISKIEEVVKSLA